MRPSIRGFTLIEMLGVIAIILILATLSLGIAKYAKLKAQRSRADAEMGRIEQACHRYMADKAIYPNSIDEIGSEYVGLSLESKTDPWGVLYRFSALQSQREFVVGSFGPDMKPGVANYDDDRFDLQHPWRSNGVDLTLWTEFGYGDDMVRGDCAMKIRFPPSP